MTPPPQMPRFDRLLPPPPDAVAETILRIITAPLGIITGTVQSVNNEVVGVANDLRQLPNKQ